MKFSEIIQEATPRQTHRGARFYHATCTEKAAKGILKTGIQPPDIERPKAFLSPVPGKVYLTQSIEYACIYALGGVFMGTDVSDRILKNDGRYGYVFVIDGKDLAKIQPDEDSIGEFVSNKTFPWLNRLASYHLTDNQQRKVDDGWYQYWASAGKKLVKQMTPAQKLQLIDAGAHVANDGPVRPSECWKIDKRLSKDLWKDGWNFFDLAERVR